MNRSERIQGRQGTPPQGVPAQGPRQAVPPEFPRRQVPSQGPRQAIPSGSCEQGVPPQGLRQAVPTGCGGQGLSKKAAAKEAERARKAAQRASQQAKETAAQREARLKKDRDRKAAEHAVETPAQTKARQEADKKRTAKSRAAERGERPKGEWTLAKEKGGLAFREFERKKQKERLSRETPDERESRLQKMREYSASRRANKAISSKEREATRERVAAFRARRTPEEVQHDREKAKEGMKKTWERRSDYTADEWADICRNRKEIIGGGQRRGKHHHDRTCPVRMWRLKVAAGTEAGPEPMYNGRLQNCHYCDQDMELPLAGEARCWKTGCYTCSKLFGLEEEWCKKRNIPYKKKEGEEDEA